MRKLIVALFAALFMLGAGAPAFAQKEEPAASEDAGDRVTPFDSEDAEMNAAIDQARQSYARFLADFQAAPERLRQYYMVKVGLPADGGGQEHIWVDTLHMEGERLMGRLANRPVYLPGMELGSPVEVRAEQISDWSITRADGMYGNFTTRVMIGRMSNEEAAPYRRAMSVTPLPTDWVS